MSNHLSCSLDACNNQSTPPPVPRPSLSSLPSPASDPLLRPHTSDNRWLERVKRCSNEPQMAQKLEIKCTLELCDWNHDSVRSDSVCVYNFSHTPTFTGTEDYTHTHTGLSVRRRFISYPSHLHTCVADTGLGRWFTQTHTHTYICFLYSHCGDKDMHSQPLSYQNDSTRRSCSCREAPISLCEKIKNIHTNTAADVRGTRSVSCFWRLAWWLTGVFSLHYILQYT